MRGGWQGLAALLVGVLGLMSGPVSADPLCTDNFATGGTVSLITEGSTQYCVHSFITGGTFTTQSALDIEYLIVGGGGGGGSSDLYSWVNYHSGGGGGAGGVRQGAGLAVSVGNFGVVVGQGGAGGSQNRGANGGNSSFNGLIAEGGGGGGGSTFAPSAVPPSSGGSGGGGGGRQSWNDLPATLGASGTIGQGNSGGNGRDGSNGGVPAGNAPEQTGGGGGGAGGAGGNGLSDLGGVGGVGITSTITGASVGYAGGGGGGHRGATGSGGSASQGGGAGGGGSTAANPGNGAANTGGGGGGAGRGQDQGGNGGSGVVVVRYLVPDAPQANAGPDQSVGSGASVALDGTTSTPVGQISYNWTQTAGPFITLTNASSATPSFTAPTLSACQSNLVFTFSLVVTDGFNRASAPDTVTIAVAAPSCPPGGGIGGSEINEYNEPDGSVTWRAHSYFGNGTLTLSAPTIVDYLIVGGGGGGGSRHGGGGGAGEFRTGTVNLGAQSHAITVGTGGVGASAPSASTPAVHGNMSAAFGVIARGGNPGTGGGGSTWTVSSNPASGGAGSGGTTPPPHTPGAGNPGGAGHIGSNGQTWTGGGGGGAGGSGSAGTETLAGSGGVGLSSSISGGPVWYAGGGGGGTAISTPGLGGLGGGGAGGQAAPAQSATPNTGGGGGGGGFDGGFSFSGGNGGSGIVVARYVINTRPTANAGPDATAFAAQEFTLDGTGSSDPDNNITSYAWEQTGGTSVTLSDTSATSPTFTPDQPASGGVETLTFELTVTDAFGLSHTDTIEITLQGVAELSANKTVFVFSEDGSNCNDLEAATPEEPALPAAVPGACIQYTIAVQNAGPVAAEAVNLTDVLPASLTLVDAFRNDWNETAPGFAFNFTPGCNGAGCSIEVENGIIPANTTATITIRAIIN